MAICFFLKSSRALYVGLEEQDWISKFDKPLKLPPLSWCSNEAIGIAVPVSKRYYKNMMMPRDVQANGSEIFYVPQNKSYWEGTSKSGYCRTAFAPNFFQGRRKKRSAAVLGETHLFHCGTQAVKAGNHKFFSNVFSPPGMQPLFISCTCDATGTDGRCRPMVRKLETLNLTSSPQSQAQMSGNFLPVRVSAGKSQDVQVAYTRDRYVFKFSLMFDDTQNSDVYPWPTECTIKSHTGKQVPIIAYGCPVSTSLDFQLHDTKEVNSLVFSTLPFAVDDMKENENMVVQCVVAPLRAKSYDLLEFCVSPIAENESEPLGLSHVRRLLGARSNVPEDRTGRPAHAFQKATGPNSQQPMSIFSPGGSHFEDDKYSKLKDYVATETTSRINAIKAAVEDGEFGDIKEVLQKSEEEEESRRMEGLIPPENIIVPQIFNQYLIGPSAVSWGVDRINRAVDSVIAHPGGYGFGGISPTNRRAFAGVGVRGNNFQTLVDVPQGEVEVGFAKKRYGVMVDRNTATRGTALEVRARATDFVTFVDFLDRAIGQRVGIRNFGISLRTDLDDFIDPSDQDFTNELFVQYKKLGVAVGTDMLDTKYYVSVGLLGVNVAAMRDFNSYHNRFQVNWGRGWQVFLEGDFPDDDNDQISNAVGIGKPGRMYLAVGAGIGPEGLPMAAANLQMPNSAVGVGFLEKAGRRLQQYSITAGRYTYLWENTLIPENLMVPLILG